MQHGAGNVLGIIVAVTTALSDSWVDWDVARRAITLYQSTSISIRQ